MKAKIRTKEERKCINFLKNNGWESETEYESLYFHKKDCLSVCIDENELTFLNESGDIYTCKINIYTLIGFLFQYRQIACNYQDWK